MRDGGSDASRDGLREDFPQAVATGAAPAGRVAVVATGVVTATAGRDPPYAAGRRTSTIIRSAASRSGIRATSSLNITRRLMPSGSVS